MQRYTRSLAVLAVLTAGLTACGGSDTKTTQAAPTGAAPTAVGTPQQPDVVATTAAPSASATPTPTSSGAAPAGNACATSQLAVTFAVGQGAAGTEFNGITFRNRSGSTCTLQGYPGVSLLDQNRTQMGESAKRVPANDPVVALAPGQVATATLTVTPAACNGGAVPRSSYLRVFPPNQRADVVVSAQVYACRPAIRPVHAGTSMSTEQPG